MELMGLATHLRQGYGAAGIEGKVARVATSELGSERVSTLRNLQGLSPRDPLKR